MSASWRREFSSSSETRLCSLRSVLSASPASERARSSCEPMVRKTSVGGHTSLSGQPGMPAAGIPRPASRGRRHAMESQAVLCIGAPQQPDPALPSVSLGGFGTRTSWPIPISLPIKQGARGHPALKTPITFPPVAPHLVTSKKAPTHSQPVNLFH